jgi:hypothetical protein
MNYRYLFLIVLLSCSLTFAQQHCPEPTDAKREVPAELKTEGFELSMAKGPFLLAMSGRYAYLRIASFSKEFTLWNETLVSMMKKASGAEGLVLDLRNSSGEDMELAYKLAGCFVSEKQTGHHSYDFEGRHVRSHMIKPSAGLKAGFGAPVVILTNRYTRSVGEIATLVLSQFDHVTLLGSPTAGSINPGPDGRQHRTATRVSFEDRGIPVDIAVCEGKALFEKSLDLLRGTFRPKTVAVMKSLR